MAHRPWRAQQRDADSQVRRLLAEARHTEPVPADVAERLDRVLADLTAARQGDPDTGRQVEPATAVPVADLAARRRRRATTLLVAAAAVVAVGVGIDRLTSSSTTSSSGSSSASADRAGGAQQQSGAGARQGAGSDGIDAPGQRSPSGSTPQGLVPDAQAGTLTPLVRLRADHFSQDAARARRVLSRAYNSQAGTLDSSGSAKQEKTRGYSASPGRSAVSCERADWGRGRTVGVLYDHAPAVLVLRPPRGETQVVDLYRCGSTDLLRSSTLPRR
jgi:hypothetical protein